jgi:hypothetical protein
MAKANKRSTREPISDSKESYFHPNDEFGDSMTFLKTFSEEPQRAYLVHSSSERAIRVDFVAAEASEKCRLPGLGEKIFKKQLRFMDLHFGVLDRILLLHTDYFVAAHWSGPYADRLWAKLECWQLSPTEVHVHNAFRNILPADGFMEQRHWLGVRGPRRSLTQTDRLVIGIVSLWRYWQSLELTLDARIAIEQTRKDGETFLSRGSLKRLTSNLRLE